MAARKKFGWGGARPGAGRPKGSGSGPPNARKSRVATMLTDSEFKKLNRLAARKKASLATLAYEFMAKGLKDRALSAPVSSWLPLTPVMVRAGE